MTETGFDRIIKHIDDRFSHLETSVKNLENKFSYDHAPHDFFTFKENEEKCYEDTFTAGGQRFQHLFHTNNHQLNNISDMLAYIIKNCCCKGGEKSDPIKNELEQAKNKIHEIIIEIEERNKQKSEPLNDLKEIIKLLTNIEQKQDVICMPEKELRKLLGQKTQELSIEIKDKGKQPKFTLPLRR
ncbi:hypothetical protein [Soymovirus malvae]|nr:hypothetical protein [Malva associated soymovirus 1]